jgi:DNA polymerase elongation subunit (family B)
MCFDANTLMNRLRKLGCDAEYEFTAKDFRPWAYADYNRDTFNTEPTDNGDVFNVACYTIYLDQMLLYAQLRKTSGKKESYSLDHTLRSELKEHKFEYEGSIRDLAYRSFIDFIIYGAIDVVPMAALEEKTEDIALAYQLSMTTRTRFHKIMKKTICLRNLAMCFYRDRGLVLSNNRNRNKERTDTAQFRGAFVADPKLMDATGILVGGQPSDRVFDDVVDFDATSLYPSIILATNIDASGQVGRLVIPQEDGTDADASLLVEAWASGDMVEVGKAWLGLPGIAELAELVLEPQVTA